MLEVPIGLNEWENAVWTAAAKLLEAIRSAREEDSLGVGLSRRQVVEVTNMALSESGFKLMDVQI